MNSLTKITGISGTGCASDLMPTTYPSTLVRVFPPDPPDHGTMHSLRGMDARKRQ